MPHKTKWEKEGILWQFYGNVSFQEINETNFEVYGDARVDDIKYFIWDATDVDLFDAKLEEADIPAVIDKSTISYIPNIKGALVAKDKRIRRFLERYIHTSLELGSPWKFKLFECIDDARRWVSAQSGLRD